MVHLKNASRGLDLIPVCILSPFRISV